MNNHVKRAVGFLARLAGFRDHLEGLDEQARRRVRAAQIEAIVRLAPLTLSVNFLNAAVVAYVFWDSASWLFIVAWGGMVLLLSLGSFLSWQRARMNPPKGASARAVRRFVLHAAILAATWGLVPVVLFPGASLLNQLFLACVVAGMISGGAFCLSTIPSAGITYTWVVVASASVGLISTGDQAFCAVALMLTIYSVFLSRNLVAHGMLFAEHMRDKLNLEEQREVIGVLLKDFESHAGDWLWQTDAKGRMTHVSERFASVAGRSVQRLEGVNLAEIIGGGARREPAQSELFDLIDRRLPFRDLVVPVGPEFDRRFWQMSAKPMFDSHEMFNGYRGVGGDITEKQVARERIAQLAQFDTLTGLLNRSFFTVEADRALATARARRQTSAMFCVDLDQFKSVNDTLGHHVGDELLRRVAQRLRQCVGDRGLIGRLGGDEFAILHTCPDHENCGRAFAEELLACFDAAFSLDQGEIAIGASIGIALASDDNWTKTALMKLADMALYSAKSAGAGSYRFFEPEMATRAHRRREIEVGLREAVASRGLGLAFQPLVDLANGHVIGFEALARWNSPALGRVSPHEFIPVAETTGLIMPIGEWVLRKALRAARHWPEDTIVAVNMSPVQFRSPKLLATVVSALAESGLPPQRLELEVTESVFLAGSGETLALLNDLRTLGVRISLDDFGTGYSSLSYLRRFPFDKIKIDKAFVHDVVASAESEAIVQAIIALAGALGMTTVAEGIESEAQVAKLRELGCTQAQGYFFAAPRATAELGTLLSGERILPGDGLPAAPATAGAA
jgi:diguanylate cyclase (GGDEF)-like protein